MVKLTQGPSVSSPSSSLGIMRFFDVDTKGPKLTPELIVGVAVVFTVLVLVLQNFV